MNLLDSLLDAIVRLDGDALVMHVGEKPYVVTTSEATNEFRGPLAWGQVELSSRVLTLEAVRGMLGQILPIDQRSALEEFGATEFQVASASAPRERFTIIAAQGGDDIWLEIRRAPRVPVTAAEDAAPEPAALAPVPLANEPPALVTAVVAQPETGVAAAPAPPVEEAPAPLVTAPPIVVEAEPVTPSDGAPPEPVVATREPATRAADMVAPLPAAESLPVSEPPVVEAIAEPAAPVEPVLQDAQGHEEEVVLSLDDEVTAVEQPWGDEVMTEVELGELLRASAEAVVTGNDPRDPVEPAALENAEPAAALPDPAVPQPVAVSDAVAAEGMDEPAASPGAVSVFEEPFELSGEPPLAVDAIPPVADVRTAERQALLAEQETLWAEAARAQADTPAAATAGEESVQTSSREYEEPVADAPPWAGTATMAEEPEPRGDDPATAVVAPPIVEAAPPAARPAAVVLPLNRRGRGEPPSDARGGAPAIDRLLKLAAKKGAAGLYLTADASPLIRVDGEFAPLEGEPAVGVDAVARLVQALAPSAPGTGASSEWVMDLPELGRVRCTAFTDQRGPGLIFRIVPPRAISADQLGLPAEVQALCSEADGLVLVAGGRGSGKSTLLMSFVDLVNRTRSDHVITTEPVLEFLHENRRSFISQREVRGDADAAAAAVRAACREDPDVLVIEDLRSAELVSLALEAAESGRLVFASVPASSAVAAVERMIEMFPAERREKAQASLAGSLRGIVSQVLLRRMKGGRVAAREVLLNTPAVARLILEGKTFQLPSAVEQGRRHGMMPFAEALAALVREGIVHPSHAYRKAPNREQFLAILRRDGVDPSLAERLA